MGREINRLSAKGVGSASPGKHYDGAGLYLRVEPNGSGRWVQRYRLHGREREMGLGSASDVSLKAARKERDEIRALVASGVDPIKERDRRNRENVKDRPTLSVVAHECFEARKASLKGGGTAGRWLSPIELHVLPKLGAVPIEDIDQRDIKDALAPIWNEKVDTARKALQRLSLIIEHGAAMGLDVNPNACKLARSLLGKQVHTVKHIPSMPWQEVPAFAASLAGRGAVAEALLFAILTAVRSGPVRFARWADIDLDNNIWTVPAEDMKGGEGKTTAFLV